MPTSLAATARAALPHANSYTVALTPYAVRGLEHPLLARAFQTRSGIWPPSAAAPLSALVGVLPKRHGGIEPRATLTLDWSPASFRRVPVFSTIARLLLPSGLAGLLRQVFFARHYRFRRYKLSFGTVSPRGRHYASYHTGSFHLCSPAITRHRHATSFEGLKLRTCPLPNTSLRLSSATVVLRTPRHSLSSG